ncbi:glycerophosphodiester phosphodiesterase [Fructilactobacillus vespulae]|uniref:glycerophosphoryl diester phosphodiesterase membrane domain-containing protein n=1 Tax=Fructilactobacillus vespulae TaxID=1249630 RepID=UPI0039B60671
MFKNKLLLGSLKSFFHDWFPYTLLILFVNIVIMDIILPITNWIMTAIMQINHISYLSYTNVVEIILQKPLAAGEILLLIVAILGFTFIHFSFLLNGISYINEYHRLNWLNIIKATLLDLKKLDKHSFWFYLFYFVLVLPISGIFFNSPFLSKVKIPTFILDFILTKPVFTILLLLFYVVILYIALRLLLTLPLTILSSENSKGAARKSWKLTKHNLWLLIWRMFVLMMLTTLVLALTSGGLYLIQSYFDKHQSNDVALIMASLNMGIFRIIIQFISGLNIVTFVIMLINHFNLKPQKLNFKPVEKQKRRIFKVIFGCFILVFVGISLANDITYLQGASLNKPLTLSHRGVDNGNGVQNTIPALEKTTREKPDYIEMDLHETKDHEFVVMHDENLKALANVDKAPHELTLKEMQNLTAHENGYSAKIASFDDYLTAAEKHHQKLLIEVKTTKYDSKDMMDNFINKYSQRILKDHDRVHSLDYSVISKLKKDKPELYSSYILPFNFTFPETKANAYTMEETTLSQDFVTKAHMHHQAVFAWTVNQEDEMNQMIFLNVDGIITDNLSDLKQTINENFKNPSYADRFVNYANNLQGAVDISNGDKN